ncbi:TPA: methyltransferase family protein [Photobacterium damselae]
MIRLEKKIPPLVQLLIMFCLLPLFSDRSVFTIPNPLYLMLALTLMIAGLLFCFSAVYSFRLAQTTVDPMVPEKASELVQHGIFKISRNPMYIGFVLCSAALAMWLQAPLTLVFVLGFIYYLDRFQIQPEERALWLRFGNEYTNYQKKVRRWL